MFSPHISTLSLSKLIQSERFKINHVLFAICTFIDFCAGNSYLFNLNKDQIKILQHDWTDPATISWS